MTTNFHVPIVTGENNSPDTINTRLSGLDSGLTELQDELDALVIEAGTSDAETIAARTAINYKSGSPPASLGTTVAYAAGDVYNVMAYGAVGDGVADDWTAIQSAITAAWGNGGGVVFLPTGTYKITSELTVNHNVIVRGAGRNTIIDWAGDHSTHAVNFYNAQDAGIEHLTIRNNTTVCAHTAVRTGDGSARITVRNVRILGTTIIAATISSISGNGSTITVNTSGAHGLSTNDNVHVWGTGTTYDDQYSSITVIDSDTFTDLGNSNVGTITTGTVQKTMWMDGVRIHGTDSIVEGCYISTGLYVAMRAYGTAQRNKFINNYVVDTYRGFMGDYEGGDGARHNLVSGNTFQWIKHITAKFELTAEHNIFSNNNIVECSQDANEVGTIIISGSFTTIENNNLYFDSPISDAAIDVSGSPVHTIIKGNTIEGHTGYGVLLHNTTRHCVIDGNYIEGAGTGIRFTNPNCAYITCINNRVINSASFGIRLAAVSGFVVQNNTVVGVTTSHGIYVELACYNGSITGNMIMDCGGMGISLATSSNASKFIAITGNVIYDVGKVTAASPHINLSSGQSNIAIVGNAMDVTGDADSINTGTVTNVTVVGNVTSAGLDLNGTTSAGNNY